MNLPETIKHPETFLNSPSAGFDGVFDWSWTEGCFGQGRITPMDFDGVIERKGNFLIFETKAPGTPIPKGQMITLESAYDLDCFTVIFIEGKERPEAAKIWYQPGFRSGSKMLDHRTITNFTKFKGIVEEWFHHANKNPRKKIDTSFLNRRITELETQLERAKAHLESVIGELGGRVIW